MQPDPRTGSRRHRRASTLAACALAALVAGACQRERGRPAGAPGSAPTAAPAGSTSAAVGMGRSRIVFVGRGTDSLAALVIQTVARAEPGPQLAHGLYGWSASAVGWDPFLAYEWRGAPMRAPGRIMPHGALRLFIGDDDGIQAIAYDSAHTRFRLTTGHVLATWSREDALSLSLRGAELTLNGRHYRGAVLIARDARVTADTAASAALAPASTSAGAELEGLLTDGRAYTVIAQQPGLSPLALTVRVDRQPADTSFSPARLVPILAPPATGATSSVADPAPQGSAGSDSAADPPADAGAASADSVVVGWRVLSAGGASLGELRRPSPGWTGISAEPGFRHFTAVRGTMDMLGRRRRVIGVIEHGRE